MQESALDNYQIEEEIGKGSYATVYKAINKQTKEICAIKKMSSSTSEVSQLSTEISTIKECNCKNIVRYLDTAFTTFHVYIMMEYCCGGSVKDVMRQLGRTMKPNQISVIVKDILNGLDYLHTKNRIHRDVKAANILLNSEGIAKLADFGVSEKKSAELDTSKSCDSARKSSIIGTPLWLPPEVLNQSPDYGFAIDIWSLGITVIEMADGQPPFSNLKQEAALSEIKNLDQPSPTFRAPEEWPASFLNFLALCLNKDPGKRKSANELLGHEIIQNCPRNDIIKELVREVCSTRVSSQELEANWYRKAECSIRELVNSFAKYKERRMKVIMVDQMTNSLKAVGKEFKELLEKTARRSYDINEIQAHLDALKNEIRESTRERDELRSFLNNQKDRQLSILDQLDKIREKQKVFDSVDYQRKMKLRSLEDKNN